MRGRHLIAVPSPLGDLWLAGDGTHLTGLFIGPPPWATGGAPEASEASEAYVAKVAPFPAAVAQLGEYFAGWRRAFDLPLAPAGTPFQRRVWQALLDVPYGQTVTYGELAARLGQPGASRAVGAANGRNPIAIVIPCHRVVGAGGALTGYGGGLERKRWLLRLEAGALTPEPAFTCQRGLAGGG